MKHSAPFFLLLICLSLGAMLAGAFLELSRPVSLVLVFGGLVCLLASILLLGLSLARRCPHCGWPIPARVLHVRLRIPRCPRCGAILEDQVPRK